MHQFLEEPLKVANAIAEGLPALVGPEFGRPGYERPFADKIGGLCATASEFRHQFDVLVDGVGLELSAGNFWLDRIRLARLSVTPPKLPVVYGFIERELEPDPDNPGRRRTRRISRVFLALPAKISTYLEITPEKARSYVRDDEDAPSTLNSQQHVRGIDVLYFSDLVVRWTPQGPAIDVLPPVPKPPKRKRRS